MNSTAYATPETSRQNSTKGSAAKTVDQMSPQELADLAAATFQANMTERLKKMARGEKVREV